MGEVTVDHLAACEYRIAAMDRVETASLEEAEIEEGIHQSGLGEVDVPKGTPCEVAGHYRFFRELQVLELSLRKGEVQHVIGCEQLLDTVLFKSLLVRGVMITIRAVVTDVGPTVWICAGLEVEHSFTVSNRIRLSRAVIADTVLRRSVHGAAYGSHLQRYQQYLYG